MWPKSIKEISQIIGADIVGPGNVAAQISCVATDSRRVGADDLFVPLKGDVYDALDFVSQVVKVPGCWVLVPRQWLLGKGSIEADAGGKTIFRSADQELKNGCYLVVDDVVSAFRKLAADMRGVPGTQGSPVVVAVGGSNGKTTTKEMVVAMLGGPSTEMVSTYKSENGFIGIPKTLCSRSMTAQVRRLVLEVGIDEVGSMAQHLEIVRPDVALLTSLSHEHLEGLGNFANVVTEEMVLMEGPWVRIWQCTDPVIAETMASKVRAGDWVVVGSDGRKNEDAVLGISPASASSPPVGSVMVTYAVDTERDLSQSIELVVSLIDKSARALELVRTSLKLSLPGKHNAANCALGFAAALAFVAVERRSQASDFSRWMPEAAQQISRNFVKFVPPEMRSNLENFSGGSVLLSDCYNSNPASLRASLETARLQQFSDHQKLLFLGDMLDLGASSQSLHDDLIFELESMANCQLYLYGEAMYSVYIKLINRGRSSGLFHLDRQQALDQWLAELRHDGRPVFALVKGSRGMAMERLLPGVREFLGQT
jgi:UDP-N-acetylmuramyl pentapeptide synthase